MATNYNTPSICEHCGFVSWGKYPAYQKIALYLWNSKTAVSYKKLKEVSGSEDNVLPSQLRTLIRLGIIKKVRRGYYESIRI